MGIPTLAQVKPVLETAAQLVVILGLPGALYRYYRTTAREATDREYGTYNALDDKYLEFQKLCLEFPRLDVSDIPLVNPPELNEFERQQELIAFTMLMSVFERAFLMYKDQGVKIRREQWDGWHEYIEGYCRRANFRGAWEISGKTFDARYQAFMKDILRRTAPEPHRD